MLLIEGKLDLVSVKVDEIRRDEVRFIPDLREAGGKGVRDLVNSWIGSFQASEDCLYLNMFFSKSSSECERIMHSLLL